MTSNKNTIFCTKCGKKNSSNSTYCTECGSKLINPGKIAENESAKKYEEDKRLNQVTLENMSSKISEAVFMVSGVIVKDGLGIFGFKKLKSIQPTIHDSYSTKVFVILIGTLRYASDITDAVKRKILDDLDTDLDINKVGWATTDHVSLGLRNKGWNVVLCDAEWYVWPVNGSTVKSLITVNYTGKVPKKSVVVGRLYTQDDMDSDKLIETIWGVIGLIGSIILVIFYIFYLITK